MVAGSFWFMKSGWRGRNHAASIELRDTQEESLIILFRFQVKKNAKGDYATEAIRRLFRGRANPDGLWLMEGGNFQDRESRLGAGAGGKHIKEGQKGVNGEAHAGAQEGDPRCRRIENWPDDELPADRLDQLRVGLRP